MPSTLFSSSSPLPCRHRLLKSPLTVHSADGSGDACGAAVESDTVAEATPDDATTATYEDATGEEEEDAAAVTQKKGVAGQGGQGCDYDGDEGPAVASEFPLEEAIKAGLRHHPSFAEVDTVSSRK